LVREVVGMKKCGLIIRVSTDKQAENEEGSLKNQLQRLNAHIEYKNMAEGKKEWLEAGKYVLRGVSGKDSFRSPEFARLFEDMRIGKVNTVLCTSLDRVSRSVKDFLNFFEILTKYNVEFVCLKQNYDTTSSQGKLFITIMMALAEFEREQTSERNREATLARAERGLWNGGHLIGYDVNPEKRGYLFVNEKEKALVQFAFRTYIECGAILETVKRLNRNGYRTKAYSSRRGKYTPPKEFAYTSVQRILRNYAYIAKKEVNKRWMCQEQESLPEKKRYRLVKAVWEPLIDEHAFNQVQYLLKKNYSTKHNATRAIKHVYILNSGKLRCGHCESEMEGGSGTSQIKKRYYYYVCKNPGCRFRLPAHEIERFIITYIRGLACKKEHIGQMVEATNGKMLKELPQLLAQKTALQKELEEVKNFAQGLLDQWTGMATDNNAVFLKDKLNELGKRRKEIEDALVSLDVLIEEVERDSVDQEMFEKLLVKFNEVFDSMLPYQQKELVDCLLHNASVSNTKMKIALYGRHTDTRLFDLLETQGDVRPEIPVWLPGLDDVDNEIH
jgi:site-specific DNA recombinase